MLNNAGTPAERQAALHPPADFDVLLTPYSLAIKDAKHLLKFRWKTVVWDDGLQELRRGFCEGSNTWKLHQALCAKKRFSILLSLCSQAG